MYKSAGWLLALALLTPLAQAAEAAPPIGQYGFDWLHPDSARCIQVTEKNKAQFQHCQFHPEGGSFGLTSLPYYTCTVSKKVEYMVYKSKAACIEAKETMEANAP